MVQLGQLLLDLVLASTVQSADEAHHFLAVSCSLLLEQVVGVFLQEEGKDEDADDGH